MPASTRSFKVPLLLALACLAGYAPTLRVRELFHDDRMWIESNPLLHRGLAAVPKILTTGYVEPVLGAATPIQEYRPLLVLSYLLHALTTGFDAAPMHAFNLALHWLVCLLLWRALARRTSAQAAAAAALAFAVLPVHVEAVTMVGWRSEVMTAGFVLAAWLALEDGREALGAALFSCGLLTKEPAILFPAFYALADWTFHRRAPWSRPRVYAVLGACVAVYFGIRFAVLSQVMHGGVAYFHSRLTAALTLPGFMLNHYLWPAATGLGLCSDYTRPLIPDAEPSFGSVLALLSFVAVLAWAARASLKNRAVWAFWLLGPCLFLAPTSHLIFPLDTIGAERFLYIPTLGLAAGLGWLFQEARKRNKAAAHAAAGILLVWYLALTVRRNEAWSGELGFYQAAAACNPVSPRAKLGLGDALIARGDSEGARSQWLASAALDPSFAEPLYDLGLLAWNQGDKKEAEDYLRRALAHQPSMTDAWILLSTLAPAKQAEEYLLKAVALNPEYALARFNLGRFYFTHGKPREGLEQYRRFVALAPDDPAAPQVRALLEAAHAR